MQSMLQRAYIAGANEGSLLHISPAEQPEMYEDSFQCWLKADTEAHKYADPLIRSVTVVEPDDDHPSQGGNVGSSG